MKIAKFLFITLMATSVFVSCKKDHDEPQSGSIEGQWEGTYINDASGNSFYYSLNFKPGGVIEEINSSGQKTGEGTWEIDGNNIITAKYHWLPPSNSSFSIIGAFYPGQGKILGNWGYGNSATNGGTYEMEKK